MRSHFFRLLMEQMDRNKKIVLLFADMGRGIYEEFKDKFPDRVLNIGIAEQNMIGIAAGIASCGYRVYCYTISNFLVERCYEQIRDDICIPNYPITLIGTSTGYDSGIEGISHFSIEDIGIMKTLPNMYIYSPSTVQSVANCFREIAVGRNPAYIRIGKGSYKFEHGDSSNYYTVKREDTKIVILTYGNTLEYCNEAAVAFDCVSVMAFNQLVPADTEKMKEVMVSYDNILVVEEQLKSCGLYNILCQESYYLGVRPKQIISIAPEDYSNQVGTKNFFADKYGYSTEKLSRYIRNIVSPDTDG